jgi:hypothetical protein
MIYKGHQKISAKECDYEKQTHKQSEHLLILKEWSMTGAGHPVLLFSAVLRSVIGLT